MSHAVSKGQLLGTPSCDGYDEAHVFRARCGNKTEQWAALRREWRHRRGLVVRWRVGGNMYTNLHGTGLLLGAVYRLHALCQRVHRYCYMILYDTPFEQYFGYSDGGSWAPTKRELAAYNSTASVSLRCLPRSKRSHFIETELEDAVANQTASLVSVTVQGWIPLYASDRGNAAEVLRAPPVDPCLSRDVTQPRDELRYRSLMQLAAPMAVHLRTGFADALDGVIGSVVADARSADDWLSAACGSHPFGDSHTPRYVLSDSAGLLRSLVRSYPAIVRVRRDVAPRNQSSRSWWTTSKQQQFEVLDDIVLAGLSRVLTVAPQRKLHKNGQLDTRTWSSMFWPVARRSMCLTEVQFEMRECPDFERVFLRDLPVWLQLRMPFGWAQDSRNPHADRAVPNLTVLPARRPLHYEALRAHGFLAQARFEHPCKRLRSAAQCYRAFVAALK